MIDTLYVTNLDDDATVYDVVNWVSTTEYLHLFDDCSRIKNPEAIEAKSAATQFDDAPICEFCTKRFINNNDGDWSSRGWEVRKND
jgi:hypothetical protein